MRLIATIIFIIQLLFIPGPQTVWVPSTAYLGWQEYTATIPPDYYQRGCVIPAGMDVEYWLTELDWPYPYTMHAWDCSDTSAYTEWALENCGYNADIVVVELPTFGHAFVMIEIDGEKKPYETTSRKWYPKLIGLLHPDMVFPTIHSLRAFRPDDTLGFGREFAWWQR